MRHPLCRLAVAFAFLTMMTAASAFGQGGVTTSLSGTVVDSSGGVIPGATITLKNNATAGESMAITGENGTFSIPALQPGKYTATVTLQGFKTVTLNDVEINAGTPASIRVAMQVGGLEENVVVQAASEIVQTQTSSVSTTLNANIISNVPLVARGALNAVVSIAGVNTPGTVRESTINGLPQSTINITLDGMSVQDNYLKTTDGFFARLNPSLDAVEEVTVTSAANGADASGQGASNIRMVTRSGSNRFTGSSYYYFRSDVLNTNTWFNNRDLAPDPATGKAPKAELIQHQPGTRVGGAVVIPGVFDGHDKLFFFVNYEESRSPRKATFRRNLFSPAAERGIFSYAGTGGATTQVDLLDLAARNGQTSSVDPTVAKLIADVRASTSAGQLKDLSDPNLQELTYQSAVSNYTPSPTVRIDYNLTSKHRLTGSYNYQHINSNPDTTNNVEPRFPGFPVTASQQSTRYTTSEALRSVLTPNLVNEVRFGGTGGATLFSPEFSSSMWSGSLANTNGFQFGLNSNALPVANVASGTGNQSREASTKVIEEQLNWIRGAHSLMFGGSFTQADLWFKQKTFVPTIDFGIATGDPADAMFTTANFPGASATQLTAARELYSIMTGRVNQITGNARFNAGTGQYEYLGLANEQSQLREYGFFVQDSWRMRTNMTVNVGLRYELQMPFSPRNDSYFTGTLDDLWGVSGVGNLFQPGVQPGSKPVFNTYKKGTQAYNTDRNNFAPSLGLAWTPDSRDGVLGKLIGETGDSVLRAGYSISYNRPGMSDFRAVASANPGVTLTVNRDATLGTLVNDGLGLPILIRDQNRLGPAPFPLTQQTPFTEVITGDINIFDPNIQVPYSQTYTAGLQRKISRNMAIDVRYVGTRHLQPWQAININEADIIENGFLQEFRNAQANLQANIAAGRGATFRYFGAGTGTVPLPIYLSYFSGINASRAGDQSLYTSTQFANSNFVNPLAKFNPNPFTPAGTNANTGLDGDPGRRANALAAGLPANFFRANPDLMGGANITTNGGYSRYNSLQVDLNKRLSHGLQFQSSYVFGRAILANRYSFRRPYAESLDTGAEGGVTHAFKTTWVYELPFGHGRRWGGNVSGVMDRIIGGWSFDGLARIQSGRLLDFGNVRLVGMTKEELQKAIKIRDFAPTGLNPNAAVARYILPQDIVENTVRAYSVSATSASGYGTLGAPTGRYLAPANGPDCIEIATTGANAGYGDCAPNSLEITGPMYWRIDLSAVKRVRIAGRTTFEFRGEFLNAFNHPNFTPVIAASNTADNYRVTGLEENGNRTIQLVTRFSW